MEPKYVVQTDLTQEEHEKYHKVTNGNRKAFRIYQVVFTIWTLLLAISAYKAGDFFWVIIFIVAIVYVLFGMEYQTKKRIKEQYNQDCLLYGNVSTISFYEDHFETRNLVTHSSYDWEV